ncbi:MAG: OmpH family outer membrane protein [Cytophagales bacterium]|nr:OmpH family outer membrane protein [Cytophagales bacterium]
MKGRLLLTLLGVLALFNLHAESKRIKIGKANMEYIFNLLPETKKISLAYNNFEEQLFAQLSNKFQELREKTETFEKGRATMTEAVRKQKEDELKDLQSNIEEFQIEAQESLAKKHIELTTPLQKKVIQAIEEVAKENGYTHVFRLGIGETPILLYAEEDTDISDLVLKKLGILPQAKQPK